MVQSFFASDVRSRSHPRPEKCDFDDERKQRATTPGRSLLGEISSNLKPVAQRKSIVALDNESKACDFTKHFKVLSLFFC